MRPSTRTLICALILLAAAGCAPQRLYKPAAATVEASVAPELIMVNSVGVVPFEKGPAPRRIAEQITEAFLAEVQRGGVLRTVVVRDDTGRMVPPPGLFENRPQTVEGMIRVRQHLGIDAVFVGRITQYQPYVSPVLGLDIRLISCKTGETVWEVSDVFDSSRPDVFACFERYCRHQVTDSRVDWEVKDLLVSPERYTRFVSHEMASTLGLP